MRKILVFFFISVSVEQYLHQKWRLSSWQLKAAGKLLAAGQVGALSFLVLDRVCFVGKGSEKNRKGLHRRRRRIMYGIKKKKG